MRWAQSLARFRLRLNPKVSPGKYLVPEPKRSPRPLLKGQVADGLLCAVHQLAHPCRVLPKQGCALEQLPCA